MVFDPNANWTAEVAKQVQHPVYYVTIAGSSKKYATAPTVVGLTADILMEVPQGGGGTLDIVDGVQTLSRVSFELIDIAGQITDELIGTDRATGSLVPHLVNRQCTIFGGYAGMAVADVPAIFTGLVSRIEMDQTMTRYRFTLRSVNKRLDQQIMSKATDLKPTNIVGNAVNMFYSILTGTFVTSGSFPLATVSTDTGTTSAPTGLSVAVADINTAQLISERDTWHIDDTVELDFNDIISGGRQYLQQEFFRIFQCFMPISGDGTLGLKFFTPPLPPGSAPKIGEDDIIAITKWERQIVDHMNSFEIRGDHSLLTGTFNTELAVTETTEDTDNQSETVEKIIYKADSKWLKTAHDGLEIAEELAGRLRIRYLATPVKMEIELPFTKRAFEPGDDVSVTHSQLPDTRTGLRGVTDKIMTITAINPNFRNGTLKVTLLDAGLKRYGTVMPQGESVDYGSASNAQKNQFGWIGLSGTNVVGASDEGYLMV